MIETIRRNQSQSGWLACNRRVRVRVMCDGVPGGEPRAREGLPPELVPDEGVNQRSFESVGDHQNQSA
jgi:hypothetical protein